MASSGVVYANEYPLTLKVQIESCASRYSAVLTYSKNTIIEIRERRAKGFTGDLAHINKAPPPIQDFFVEFSGPNIISNFEAFLISTKSLLDVLARLLSQLIPNNLHGFSRKGTNYGGKVLNVLQNTSHSNLPNRDKIIDLIERHKILWIDDLISMRDHVVHDGELKDLINFWTILKAGREKSYTIVDIFPPELKARGQVELYCQKIQPLITDFTVRFLDLLFPKDERNSSLASHST